MRSFRAFEDCSLDTVTRPLSGVQTIQMDPLLDAELVIVDYTYGEVDDRRKMVGLIRSMIRRNAKTRSGDGLFNKHH